jgi:glycine cleavage system H protein
MEEGNLETRGAIGRKTKGSCIWRESGAVSAQTCESRPDDCEGCPIYTTLKSVGTQRQVKFFNRDYFDWCSVDACAVPGQPCPFAKFCMANWSRTNASALQTLTLMGIGGLSIGANASLIQQTGRRTGLYADLLSRVYELKNSGVLGPEGKLAPKHLGLQTTEEQFAMVAAASFLDCLDTLDLPAFAETMLENALLPRGLSESVSAERDYGDLLNAFRAVQGLGVLGVLSAFDIKLLAEMQATMAISRYPSMVIAQTALTVQRIVQIHTRRPPNLAARTVERAATLVGFASGLMGKVYDGMLVTPPELAASVIVARTLGAIPEDGTVLAGRVLVDELLCMAEAGPLDPPFMHAVLAGIVASGLPLEPEMHRALSRAMRRSFQERFRKLGDMRADPVSLLACLGADNLVREGEQFDALASTEVPAVEVEPELLGCEMPVDRFYCRQHAWVQPGRDGSVMVGLDDLVAHLIGRVDAIKMPKPGQHLRRGKPALSLIRGGESVDVHSPINGDVMVVNQSVVDSPNVLPERPYGDGWLLALRPTVSEEDLSGLMFGRVAREWQQEEARRLGEMFRGKMATAADGATLAHDALAGIRGVSWSKVLRKFLKV